MRVKNHMAIWFLWFLWFLRVECSSNPLYKPLCAFLVFVDLVWFLCGSFCGFWSRVVFWLWSARPIALCGFCGSVVLPRCRSRRLRVRSCLCGFWSRVIVSILEIVAKDINVPRITGDGTCGFCGSVILSRCRCRCRRLRVLLLFVDC